MTQLGKIFRIFILVVAVVFIIIGVQIYNAFEQQHQRLSSLKDKLDAEAEFNTNKFKYQEDQIERISKDLDDAHHQLNDQKYALADQKDALAAQKEALLQEVEKRQQIANQNQAVQKSLVDITAEADVIKQQMKDSQKDFVTVLADFEKKIDYSQDEIKELGDNLDALNIPELKQSIVSLQASIDKMSHPAKTAAAEAPATEPAPEKKIERADIQAP